MFIKDEIRSQLAGGPGEIFAVRQSFFGPPGATHRVSANASNTESRTDCGFVADEGAQLTTPIDDQASDSTTRNPSRGFGIGHICQSGAVPGSSATLRFCRKCRAKHFACI